MLSSTVCLSKHHPPPTKPTNKNKQQKQLFYISDTLLKMTSVALSEEDLRHNLQQYGIDIVDYADLSPASFDDNGLGAIVVYHTNPNNSGVGHWTLVTKRSGNNYEHFDSLAINGGRLGDLQRFWGLPTHDPSRWVGTKWTVNKKPLQNRRTNTCGRWIIWRVLFLRLTLTAFVKMCKMVGVNDKFLATKLTMMRSP